MVKLVCAVKPLIGRLGFGLSRSVGLDPLVVGGGGGSWCPERHNELCLSRQGTCNGGCW